MQFGAWKIFISPSAGVRWLAEAKMFCQQIYDSRKEFASREHGPPSLSIRRRDMKMVPYNQDRTDISFAC